MKTYSVKAGDIKREWHLIDASGKILGRMAVDIARLLMGKHKPIFTPNQDTGDYVVVVNAAQVKVTGDKEHKKLYYRHSGYPGGMKVASLEKVQQKDPTRIIEHAVKGMLPRNRLGAAMIKKLRVYAGAEHPHLAQLQAEAAEK
ncbi:MAG: 50S ribosomal protein L13 [Chloroflexota bacterium]